MWIRSQKVVSMYEITQTNYYSVKMIKIQEQRKFREGTKTEQVIAVNWDQSTMIMFSSKHMT